LIRADGASSPTLRYFFEGIVIVESLAVALQLWEQHQWSAPTGPTCVTLSGETLDAAGVMTGGGSSASGGLLQRRLGLPDASVLVLQGIIFVFVLASDALYGRIGFLKGKS
jgi:chromosome segregation ATPase